ncbi:MAG: hypothetical protein HQM04_03395 [Magnetococcales bacterium]|nr:hypothetical protein [Magnetococcales bacterium]MBF0114068.1 hypothetical protein [Magnetococcales bacterium]
MNLVLPAPAAAFLPHAPPMVLIDQVLFVDAQRLIASTRIQPPFPFYNPEGVGIHIGMEIMAQACGVYAGWHDRVANKPIRPGLLLAVRRFMATTDRLLPGSLAVTAVESLLSGEELGVFLCTISVEDHPLAHAQLSLMRPGSEREFTTLISGNHG